MSSNVSSPTTLPPQYYQKASWNLAAAIILPIIDVIAVALRLLARRKQRLKLQLDDWLAIPALILVLGAGAAMISGIAENAIGHPTPETIESRALRLRSNLNDTNRAIIISSKVEWAMYLITIPALGLTKLSILSFYYRIFCVHRKSTSTIAIVTMMCIICLWATSFFFAHVFACKGHFSAWWGSPVDLITKCVKTLELENSLSISDFVTDIIVISIPLPFLWNLQLSMKRKIAVSAIFLLGSVAVGASCARMAIFIKTSKFGFDPRADEDYTITGTLYWSMVEVGVGLLAACLPTLRFLFRGMSPESVVNSIRSVFSLQSLRSAHSRLHEDNAQVRDRQDVESTASQANIVAPNTAHPTPGKEYPRVNLGEAER